MTETCATKTDKYYWISFNRYFKDCHGSLSSLINILRPHRASLCISWVYFKNNNQKLNNSLLFGFNLWLYLNLSFWLFVLVLRSLILLNYEFKYMYLNIWSLNICILLPGSLWLSLHYYTHLYFGAIKLWHQFWYLFTLTTVPFLLLHFFFQIKCNICP